MKEWPGLDKTDTGTALKKICMRFIIIGSANDHCVTIKKGRQWANCRSSRFINVGEKDNIHDHSGLADRKEGFAVLPDLYTPTKNKIINV